MVELLKKGDRVRVRDALVGSISMVTFGNGFAGQVGTVTSNMIYDYDDVRVVLPDYQAKGPYDRSTEWIFKLRELEKFDG